MEDQVLHREDGTLFKARGVRLPAHLLWGSPPLLSRDRPLAASSSHLVLPLPSSFQCRTHTAPSVTHSGLSHCFQGRLYLALIPGYPPAVTVRRPGAEDGVAGARVTLAKL